MVHFVTVDHILSIDRLMIEYNVLPNVNKNSDFTTKISRNINKYKKYQKIPKFLFYDNGSFYDKEYNVSKLPKIASNLRLQQ